MGKVLKVAAGIAVGLAIAVLAVPTGGLSIALAGALGVSAMVASAIITVGLTFAAQLAFKALGLTQGAPTAQVGPPQVFRQSIADSFIVYGKRRVGGLMVFFHPRKVGKRHYRYFVIAVAGHRCKGVVSWQLGDETVTVNGAGKVTSGVYANAAWLWFQRGQAAETANATFVAECGGKWTAAHRGDGVAAVYAKFEMTDAVVEAGLPNITAVIEGKDDIADPRGGAPGYSRNGTLVFYDWMQLPREEGGFGCYPDEVPDDALIAAWANVCDEAVDGQARYALDAVIVTGAAPSEVRDAITVNCAGAYTFSGGKHLMRPGHWVPVSATLDEDDLAGPIQVSPFAAGDQVANEVSGTFVDPDAGYQGGPAPTQWIASDDVRQVNVDLSMVTSAKRAGRILRIMLRRAQAEKTVVWPMNIAGLAVTALDTVQLGTARYGLSNYAFQVGAWRFSSDWGVLLSLKEENADIYGDGAITVAAAAPALARADAVTTESALQTAIRTAYPVGLTATGRDNAGVGEIDLSAHAHQWPGTPAVAIGAATLTALTLGSTYYLFADVDTIADATPTFGATETYADALNSAEHPERLYLNQAVTLPGAGGGNTGGEGTGGGYGGGGPIP